MAKLSNNQSPVPFDASVLKKSAVIRNKKLAEANKALESKTKELKADQKQAEKALRSAQADCEDIFNELESASRELDAVQKKSLSAKKKLDERLVSESVSKSSYQNFESSLSDLQSKFNSLTSKINYLQEQEEKYKSSTQSLIKLNIDIEYSTDELARLKTSKSRFKKQTDSAAKKCNEMIKKHDEVKVSLQESTESFKAELKVIDKKLSIARVQCEKDISVLKDGVIDRNLKLDEVDVMISKAENEYLSWERKISVAKNNLLEEENRIETVKKNFKTWQVDAVEEVARMKLRGKIEKIDKAGLKDVIN